MGTPEHRAKIREQMRIAYAALGITDADGRGITTGADFVGMLTDELIDDIAFCEGKPPGWLLEHMKMHPRFR